MFTTLPPEEVERRRLASVNAMTEIKANEFERWYQERCDTFYWKQGRCCAGCGFWTSSEGDIGQCTSAPPVSGEQVIR